MPLLVAIAALPAVALMLAAVTYLESTLDAPAAHRAPGRRRFRGMGAVAGWAVGRHRPVREHLARHLDCRPLGR